MLTRKQVYAKDYIEIVNQTLTEHPHYKNGMTINFTDLSYNMVFESPNMPITSEEIAILLEVLRQVEKGYKLIHV